MGIFLGLMMMNISLAATTENPERVCVRESQSLVARLTIIINEYVIGEKIPTKNQTRITIIISFTINFYVRVE